MSDLRRPGERAGGVAYQRRTSLWCGYSGAADLPSAIARSPRAMMTKSDQASSATELH